MRWRSASLPLCRWEKRGTEKCLHIWVDKVEGDALDPGSDLLGLFPEVLGHRSDATLQ